MEEDSRSKEKLLTDSLKRSETITAPPQIQPVVAYLAEPTVSTSKFISPHSYLVLSSIVMVVCGICSMGTLFCSIPAFILSLKVSH